MAHFAQLDDNNQVINVIVVANEDCLDSNGIENEDVGVAFCKSLLGYETRWIQTSYNANFRKNYAGIGYTYDLTRDAFIPPSPYDSWVLVEETCQWTAPVPNPNDGQRYFWDEDILNWVLESEENAV
jgi:hypothetical protein